MEIVFKLCLTAIDYGSVLNTLNKKQTTKDTLVISTSLTFNTPPPFLIRPSKNLLENVKTILLTIYGSKKITQYHKNYGN